MSFLKASLKLVLQTDEMNDNGTYKTKSKTFSNVKEGANASDLEAVANALCSLQQFDMLEIHQIITNRIG